MRTSLKKLRGFSLYKHGAKEMKDLRHFPQLDELAQASQDMQDMRDCYDGLLSAAAATANSAYEFSESLREMGACLLEKTALNDDEDSGRVLLLLGKLQFELQKHVDNYRSHISQTITVPSESLLNELHTVEEMKRQCDEKREVYEYVRTRQSGKSKLRSGKGEQFSREELEMARDDYDREATLFVFRLKSLKQGQSRSLLTQAARHHAAQLCFFKKALKSLESVEPHVKLVAEQQHIDYQFGGLRDDDNSYDDDYDSDDDDDDSYDSNDDGELSFDYGQNGPEEIISSSRKSMEVDLTFPKVGNVEEREHSANRTQRTTFSGGANAISLSAPIMADNKLDPGEKLRQFRPSLTRKFHAYVLPTPRDTKALVPAGSGNPMNDKVQPSLTERTQNLWHSTPLEPKKYEQIMRGKRDSASTVLNVQSVLKENNRNIPSTQLPPPLLDGLLFSRREQLDASDAKKIKRQAFSGPLSSKPWSTKSVASIHPQLFSGPLLRNPVPLPSSSPPKSSPGTSPTFTSTPKISELHELPRPPAGSSSQSSIRPSGLVGYSGPLVSKAQAYSSAKTVINSPLPKPSQVVPRSFSIPSRGPRIVDSNGSKPMEISHNSQIADLASPPLSPITLSNPTIVSQF